MISPLKYSVQVIEELDALQAFQFQALFQLGGLLSQFLYLLNGVEQMRNLTYRVSILWQNCEGLCSLHKKILKYLKNMHEDYHLLQILLIFPNEGYQSNPFQNQYWQDVVTNPRCNVLKVKMPVRCQQKKSVRQQSDNFPKGQF